MNTYTVWVSGSGWFTVNGDTDNEAEGGAEALAKYGATFADITWHDVTVEGIQPDDPPSVSDAAVVEDHAEPVLIAAEVEA